MRTTCYWDETSGQTNRFLLKVACVLLMQLGCQMQAKLSRLQGRCLSAYSGATVRCGKTRERLLSNGQTVGKYRELVRTSGGLRLRSHGLSRPTSTHALKSRPRGHWQLAAWQPGSSVPGARYWRERGCALGCFGRCEPLGKGPPGCHWVVPVVGGARSAHDERLVTRFPPVVWPFHPSIFDRSAEQSLRPAATGSDQHRPCPFRRPFGRHLPAHLLIYSSEWHDGLWRALAWSSAATRRAC